MKIKALVAAAILGMGTVGSAMAAPGYTNGGTVNAVTYTFEATTSGEVMAYFYGQSAAYTEELGMLVDGATPVNAHVGLSNHGSSQGDSLDLGYAAAGQLVTFFIAITAGAGDTWYSDAVMNSDHSNHIYSSSFAPTSALPGTMFISFEDLANSKSDHDYNDTSYVINGVVAIPEPANMALLVAGLGLMGFMSRRRRD